MDAEQRAQCGARRLFHVFRSHGHLVLGTFVAAAWMVLLLALVPIERLNRSSPLPLYTIEVKAPHCTSDIQQREGFWRIRSGAWLSVTLRPEITVEGKVEIRAFLARRDQPPIPLSLEGVDQPSRAGTFQLSGYVNPSDQPPDDRARLLFVIGHAEDRWSLFHDTRQVLALPVEFVRD